MRTWLKRMVAGIVSAGTLMGGGLLTAGTANADEIRMPDIGKTITSLTASAATTYPRELVNGGFDYLPDGGWKTVDAPSYMTNAYTSVDPNNGQYMRNAKHSDADLASWVDWPGFDQSKFAWKTDQKGGHDQGGLKDRAEAVELQQDSMDGNTYAEMVASEPGRTIYQNLATIPGTLYKIRLKHTSLCKDNVDQMQVVINGTPIEMTRVAANGKAGDKVGEKSKTIGTRVTNENRWHHSDQWETYEGYYVIPDGQTTTRFGFKAVNYLDPTKGNLLDDVTFARAYKLSYDKNASDATGKVPSDETANTVRQTKAKTTGTVRLASDDTSGLPDHLVNGDFEYPGANVLSKHRYDEKDYNWWGVSRKDKMVYDPSHETQWVSLPSTFDSDRFAWDSTEVAGTQNGSSQWHTNEVELQRDSRTGNMYGELCAYQANTSIRQYIRTTPGVLYKVRLKHASLSRDYLDKMQVLIGSDGNEQPVSMTRIESQNGLDATGESTASTTVSTHASNEMEIKDGQDTPYSSRNHNGQWATYEGVYVATSDVTSFTFKSVDAKAYNLGNLLDDIVFDKAYRLSYDKNSTAASGQVPSNERGRENTVQPAKAKTTGTVKTVADENVRYGSLANGEFSYPSFSDIQKNEQETLADLRTFLKSDDGTLWYNMSNTDLSKYGKIGQIPGFDSSRFAWSSTENGSRVELQQDRNTKNTYAEIVAQQDNTSIYQNVSTGNGGVLYKIRLKHASRQSSHADRMQVLVGADMDHATPVEMTRVTSNGHGDKVGGKSTIITTKVSNTDPRDHGAQWETYEGYYQVPEGQKNTVFMFKSLEGFKEDETLPGNNVGNLVDDIEFSRSYKLTYDVNSSDASGQVPSDTAANTVKQAKARTTGTVRAVADRTASGLTVHDLKNGDIAPAQYGDFKFSTTDGFTADQITDVNGFTVKTNSNPFWEALYTDGTSTAYFPTKNGASLVLHHVGQWRDSSGAQRWLNARITVNGQNLGFLYYETPTHHFNIGYGKWDKKPSSRPYMDVTVDFLLDDGSTPQGLRGVTGFADLDGGTSGYNEGVELVSGFDGAYVRSDAHLTRFGTNGWGGTTDENAKVADEHGMKHYVGATFTGSSFRVRWSVASGQARASGFQPVDSTIAYRLTYDKNAADASGQVPSNTTPDTTQTASSKSTGKVSDLVQRTTTHEDGSVTVKTIDTSTDVVSGCQVYYPAGQKITLATMAKDDDCWDASMLSRPGHTQLGWNQDRNATQAQAQVTMVEGGMTVYAVWVGNPVLTYDTNKPSTWSGQMPSTPASVSVPYDAAAADGSGWRAGDTTKIRGYRFLGWYTGPQDNAGLYDWTRPLTGSVTVYAHWQRLQANVVYNANGGTGSHANTTGWQYSDVTIPGDTSKSFKHDGLYLFKHWNTQPNDQGTVYTDGSRIALQDKDITLYAIWVPYHEHFVPTGGIGLPIAIAGGVLLLMFGIGSTVMLTRRMNGHGMPDDE